MIGSHAMPFTVSRWEKQVLAQNNVMNHDKRTMKEMRRRVFAQRIRPCSEIRNINEVENKFGRSRGKTFALTGENFRDENAECRCNCRITMSSCFTFAEIIFSITQKPSSKVLESGDHAGGGGGTSVGAGKRTVQSDCSCANEFVTAPLLPKRNGLRAAARIRLVLKH